MLSHQRELIGVQAPRFQQHRVGQRDLPDVVQDGAAIQRIEIDRIQVQRDAECGRVFREALAMSFCVRIAGLDDMPEHRHDGFGRLELIGQLLHAQERTHSRPKLLHVDRLGEKSSAPASSPSMRWLRSWLPVTSITGVSRVPPRAFSSRHNSTTRHSRHHHIDQHQIWRVFGDEAQCVSAIVCNAYAVTGDGQKVAHAIGVRRVIIDNDELAERFHLVVSLLTGRGSRGGANDGPDRQMRGGGKL